MSESHEFDIAFSFAGEDREYVESLYQMLDARGVRVFYDRAHEAALWGKNLAEHLGEIYSKKARYCVLFVSRHSVTKPWTRLERQHIQGRVLHDEAEYLLPLRLDDSEVPGLSDVIAHLDARSRTPAEIADLIIQKLDQRDAVVPQLPTTTPPHIPLPRVRRQFTVFDRESFARDFFSFIQSYFAAALKHLSDAEPDVETDLRELSDSKFIATLYFQGDVRQQIKLWRGSWAPGSGSDQICYALGSRIDEGSDNSMSGWITIEDDGFQLLPKLDNFSITDASPATTASAKSKQSPNLSGVVFPRL